MQHSERTGISTAIVERFSDRLTSAGGQSHHVRTSADAAVLVAELSAGDTTIWASRAVEAVAPNVSAELVRLGRVVRTDGDPTSIRDQPLGLTVARNTIAETGSSLLVEPTLGERSVSLMTQTLIVLCPTSALLPGLDEVAPVLRDISLDAASYATLVTGPSRTADIERQLTVGVQGPAVLHVILVDELG